MEHKSGKDLIKHLEAHCNEELNCSHRLRFQIIESINRMIEEHEAMKSGISAVMQGFSAYDPKKYHLAAWPKNR